VINKIVSAEYVYVCEREITQPKIVRDFKGEISSSIKPQNVHAVTNIYCYLAGSFLSNKKSFG